MTSGLLIMSHKVTKHAHGLQAKINNFMLKSHDKL